MAAHATRRARTARGRIAWMRLVGPEMDTAATTCPPNPKTGAATQLASGSVSPLSSANPLSRVFSSSRRNAAREVMVREVRAGSPRCLTMASTSSSGRWAAIAFPSAVECTGERAPTAAAMRKGWGLSRIST